jgi:glutamyl-tRNA reductase
MTMLMTGLEPGPAPIGPAVLEQFWMVGTTAASSDAEARARFRQQLKEAGNEGILVATCHRVEFYGVGAGLDLEAPIRRRGRQAVERLFRVAAGLESAVLGEDEVLHQVRNAVAEARRSQPLDTRLGRLGEAAIAAGRRVRSGGQAPKGGLAERAITWLGGPVQLAVRPLLVAGTGAMGRALVRAAVEAGARVVTAGRDGTRADLDLRLAATIAHEMAGIAVALAGPWTGLGDIPPGPLPVTADLSFPQAVPTEVASRLGARFLGIDGLFQQAPVEAAWLERAQSIVSEAVQSYLSWLQSRLLPPGAGRV